MEGSNTRRMPLNETVFKSFVNDTSEIMDSPRGEQERAADFGLAQKNAVADDKIVSLEMISSNVVGSEKAFNTDLNLVKFNINPFHPLYNVVKSIALQDPIKLVQLILKK
jgi:hypothetical protein